MRAVHYFLDDVVDCPDHLRCKWCFDRPRPTKFRAQLRVQYSDTEYVQLCLGCWFKLAFS